MRFAWIVAGLLLFGAQARSADVATPDDTARYLAGLPAPTPDSPLAPLRAEPGWQIHRRALDVAFEGAERRSLQPIRSWAQSNITVRRPTLFYFFSGPDYLFANAFFPDADTYVLAGLEPVGEIPDLLRMSRPGLQRALPALQVSMRSLLSISFFLTNNMKSQLRASALQGTLPVLYVFLSRSGKTIQDASLVHLGDDGTVLEGAGGGARAPQGVKITFSAGAGAKAQTLYYFSTNLANDGFRNGFAQFVETLGVGDAFVKSASYLMHSPVFSQVRDFLLTHTAAILEDDSGIPVSFFDASWQLKPYGRYLGPISLFAGRSQPRLAEVFRKEKASPISFGIGYRYQPNESNLLLAIKQGAPPTSTPAAPSVAPAPSAAPPSTPAPPAPAAAPPPAAPTPAPEAPAAPAPAAPESPATPPATPSPAPPAAEPAPTAPAAPATPPAAAPAPESAPPSPPAGGTPPAAGDTAPPKP